MTDARATQVALEQFIAPNPLAQATQTALEQWASTGTTTGQALVTQVALEMWAPAFTGNAYALAAAEGAYALSGKPQAFPASRSFAAAKGTYNLTGQPISFLKAHGFVGDSGRYALTGNPQVLRQAGFGAVKGSYALAGQAAMLAVGVPAGQGAYALAGKTVAFPVHLSLLAASGRYTLSGFSPSGGSGSGPPFSGRHSLEFIADAGPMMTSDTLSASVAAPFTFPAGAAALYSLRKAGSGYAGMCVKVLRSSDGAHQDIGFDANGVVDMAAVAAFRAGSLAYVSTWYDQSGNHNDLIYNTSVGGPPQINMIGTQPWLSFYGDQFLATTGTFSGPVLNGDMNFGFVAQLNTDVVNMPMTFWDGSNGWFSLLNGNNGSGNVGNNPGTIQFYTSGGSGQTIGPTGRYFAKTNRYAVKRVSGVGTAYVNSTQIVTGAYSNNPTSAGPLTVRRV